MANRTIIATMKTATINGRRDVLVGGAPDPVAFLSTAATDAATVRNAISGALAQSNLTLALAFLNTTQAIAVQTDITNAQLGTGADVSISFNSANCTTKTDLRGAVSKMLQVIDGMDDLTS